MQDNTGKLKKQEFMKPSSDIVFKMLFGDERNTSILKDFLLSVLDMPESDYEGISILDPHLLQEYLGDKLGILDVKLRTVSGKIINIEIQVRRVEEIRERLVFYVAKLITEQIGEGDEYNLIKQTVQITIAADFLLLPETSQYKHRFLYYDPNEGIALTDISLIYALELPKLPKASDGTKLWEWLSFLGAKNEEEVKMASEANPEIKKAAIKLGQLSADERARMLYEAREKELRDIRAHERLVIKEATEKVREEAREEARANMLSVAKNLLSIGMPIETVIQMTNLSRSEIDSITGD